MPIDQNTIQRLLENDKTLKELNLSIKEINNADLRVLALALQNNTSLTSLYLSSNQIDDLGARVLADVLQENKTILKLYLGENDIGDNGILAISLALKKNRTLAWLWLGNNKFSKIGVMQLSLALKENSTLEAIDLSSNEIHDEGAITLSHTLAVNSTLTWLDLSLTFIGYDGAQALSLALKENSVLKHLALHHNDIGDAGVREISLALKENSSLVWLGLINVKIGNSGAIELSTVLRVNGTLLYLDLSKNRIGDTGTVEIALAMRENVTLIELNLSQNEFNVEGVAWITNELLQNYTLLKLEGNFSILTKELLERNQAIANCVELLMHLAKEDYFLYNHEQITSQLFNLESWLKMSVHSLPEQHFVKELYRLLCAFSHYSGVNPEGALTLLIEPIYDPRLSKVADTLYAQSLLMSNLIYSKNVKHIKIRYTLLAYTARHERNSYAFAIGISGIANPNPRHIAIDDVRRVKTNTYNLPNQAYCISYDELLCLAKHALQSALSTEMELLATVIQQQDYCPITVGVLFQSTLFIDVLKEKYPNSTTFQCLEDYLSLKQIEGFGGVYSIDASKEKETKCERAILTSYQDALKTQSQQHLSVTSNITILKQQLLTTFTREFKTICRHSIFKEKSPENTDTYTEHNRQSHSIG